PNRVVTGISVHRSRPPCPRIVVNEPPPIVIGCPAPRLIRNPRPAVVRFPNPAAISIRSPVRSLRRNPHLTVVGHFGPRAVTVQIFRSGVVAVCVSPAGGILNSLIAIVVP